MITFEFLGMVANGVSFSGLAIYTICAFLFHGHSMGRETATPSLIYFFQRLSLCLVGLKRNGTKEHGG
jgi:hypothetical protein